MSNLTTRKIVLGLLMVLVLAFSVQGIADALTLTPVSDIVQSKREGSTFEVTFSVGLTSPTIATNSAGKRVSDPNTGAVRIDSSGYAVTDIGSKEYRNSTAANSLSGTLGVGPRPTYRTNSNGVTLPTAQLPGQPRGTRYVDTGDDVVDADGVAVYIQTGTGVRANADTNTAADPYSYDRAEANPDAPIALVDRFDYNEEKIIVVSETPGNTTLEIRDKRDNVIVTMMDENDHFAQLMSRVTLVCKPTTT